MVLEILGIFVLATILAFVFNLIENYMDNKKIKNELSFKEAMDLTELPIVTFYNNGQKLNFLLDTGSNFSHINMAILPSLKYEELESGGTVYGIEGNQSRVKFCRMTVTYKDLEFTDEFAMQDLSSTFDLLKQESGVQVHGILGSLFFKRYEYILDFEHLIAYPKLKEKR